MAIPGGDPSGWRWRSQGGTHKDGDGDPRGTHKDGDPRGGTHKDGDGDPRGAPIRMEMAIPGGAPIGMEMAIPGGGHP